MERKLLETLTKGNHYKMSEKILSDAIFLAERYMEVAAQEKSTKAAKMAFDIAERAYRLAMEMAKQAATKGDPTLIFLSLLTEDMTRAELYRRYQRFCHENNREQLPQSQFYNLLPAYGFFVRRTGAGVKVKPPKDRRHLEADLKFGMKSDVKLLD
jgi:hypothetical protein